MPTYRYECAKCHRVHEFFQAMSDPPKKKCPDCGGKLERLISGGAGVILKGSGFHNTDYRSKDYHAAAKKESGGDAAAASSGGDAKKAEKPEKKDTPKPDAKKTPKKKD